MPVRPVVIAAIDFSEHSRHALQYAARLAQHFQATLTAVHVVDPLLASAARSRGIDLIPDVRQELAAFVAASTSQAPASQGVEVTVETVIGDAPAEVVSLAGEARADLIVIGTHGLTGYRQFLIGSVAAHVLRQTDLPVLAVPPTAIDVQRPSADLPGIFSCVLVPLDFSDESRHAARVGAALTQALGARLVLVHAVNRVHGLARWREDAREEERRLAKTAMAEMHAIARRLSAAHAPEVEVRIGSPAEVIADVARDREARFIVMALRGHGGLLDPRPGSLAYRVLAQCGLPVLALPARPPASSWISTIAAQAALTAC